MDLLIDSKGTIATIYDETIDLVPLGSVTIRRASHVEPDEQGRWTADLSPVGGPVLGPFALRSAALDAERAWLSTSWLESEARSGI
jgi:hypothetical protein